MKRLASRKIHRAYARSRKRLIRYGLLSANLVILALVVFFVTSSPSSSQATHNSAILTPTSTDDTVVTGPLDQVSSADIAVHIASTIRLPEVNSVVNHADSVSATAAAAPADNSVVAKPQVVSAALPSRKDIRTYTTVAGDTVSGIASAMGVSSDSIKWSNNLTGNNVTVGQQLRIPPAGVNGIVYTVAAGDTPDSLAQKFVADKDTIISVNDAEVSGLKPGEVILVQNGVIQAAPAPVRTTFFAWGGSTPVYSANGYDYGWCTWHAANRRAEIGHPVPSNLGNASSWYYIARNMGMPTGDEPQAGAVLWDATIGGLGHVAFVESINPDGSALVSDMNYPIWGRVTYRTVPPSEFHRYKFIY